MASLFSLNIGLPPVLRHGSAQVQQEVMPPVLRGEKIAALAITEPGAGSDVAGLRTTARRDGDDWVDRRREGLHHLRHARRLDHDGGAHRRGRKQRRGRHLHDPGARRRRRPVAHRAGQDGLVVFGHRAPAHGRRAGAGALPARRGGRRLQDHHEQLQRRAAGHVGHGAGLRPGLLRRGAGLGAPAQDLRQRAGGKAGDPPQAGRHADAHRVDRRPGSTP